MKLPSSSNIALVWYLIAKRGPVSYFPQAITNANIPSSLGPEHIGVIAPYHSQKCKIQQLFFKDPKLRDIKVGTVDEFQGQVSPFDSTYNPCMNELLGTSGYNLVDGSEHS